MASKKSDLEEGSKELTCAVCLEHYTEPKLLPCLHYYCKACIIKLPRQRNSISCPSCRKKVKLVKGEEEKLPTVSFITRLKELHGKREKSLRKDVQCEICIKSQVVATSFCKQCQKFICNRCVESHTLMSALFDGHEVVAMSKVHDLKDDGIVTRNPSSHSKCTTHRKPLEAFCHKCACLVCRDCTVKNHKDHKISFNDVLASRQRADLGKNLTSLTAIDSDLSRAVRRVSKASTAIENQGLNLAKNITASFKELHEILEQREQKLLKDINKRVKYKTEALREQKADLSSSTAEVHRLIEYTQQCVQHCSDVDLIKLYDNISATLDKEIDNKRRLVRLADPVEEADLEAHMLDLV